MRTVEVKVYKFEELSEEAQKKVLQRFSELNYVWWDFNDEYFISKQHPIFTERPELKFFEIEKIYFLGFYSQGDGACFEGSFDFISYFQQNPAKHLERVEWCGRMTFKHSGHYYHERSYSLTEELKCYAPNGEEIYTPYSDKFIKDFVEQVEEWYVDLALAIYKDFKEEYEYLTSREAIEGRIEVNGYEFYEDGSLV